MNFPPVQNAWFLTGPTASGKSAVGITLARHLQAEIISLDSMAVYRGMDIGTAKPTQEEQATIPHHLLDLVDPNQEFSISDYLRAAHETIEEIRSRNRQVLFVGGTPLYLKALLSGFDDGPKADWRLRGKLENEAIERGDAELHADLAKLDPRAAEKIHPHDRRRIIRALEVYHKTGETISSVQTHFEAPATSSVHLFALDWPRTVLHARINQRVEEMFRSGLIEEVKALVDRYQELGRTAAQAVGYREVLTFLRGEMPLEGALEKTQAGTRQLARRQLISLRGLAHCRFVPLRPPLDISAVVREILLLGSGTGTT